MYKNHWDKSSWVYTSEKDICEKHRDTCTSKCKKLCGDISLKKDGEHVIIFESCICEENTAASITILNHHSSSADMKVIIFFGKDECPIIFKIPPGNTVTFIHKDVTQIVIEQEGDILTQGKYLIELCPTHF